MKFSTFLFLSYCCYTSAAGGETRRFLRAESKEGGKLNPVESSARSMQELSANICPASKPRTGDKCAAATGFEICGYDPASCPGDKNDINTYQCECDGETYSCFELAISCEAPPTLESETKPTDITGSAVCPRSAPAAFDTCRKDTPSSCLYEPFSCPGSTEVTHLKECFCENGQFICLVNTMICDDLPPPQISEPEPIDRIVPAICPADIPDHSDTCTKEIPSPCLYKPVSCPGSSEVHHTHKCYCENGTFECVVSLILCEEPPREREPPKKIHLICPASMPTKSDGCTDATPSTCQYEPLSCPGDRDGDVTYLTNCSCYDGSFSCISKRIFCPPIDPVVSRPAPTEPVESKPAPIDPVMNTPAPTEPVAECVQCDEDNKVTNFMKKKNRGCSDLKPKALVRNCQKNNWKKKKFCQLSCNNYGGIECCDTL